MTTELTVEEQLQIRQISVRLQRRYEGQLNSETIERFINDTADNLLPNSTTTKWMPILIERLTNARGDRHLSDCYQGRGCKHNQWLLHNYACLSHLSTRLFSMRSKLRYIPVY